MKKVLFISTRNPFSNRYSGDVIGSKKIINILKKNCELDVVTLGKKDDFSQNNIFIFKSPVFILKLINVIKSLIYLRPLQFGLFDSSEMRKFINDRSSDYDLIFFLSYKIKSVPSKKLLWKKDY